MPSEKYLRLGEILVKEGFLTPNQLEKAIQFQKQEGMRLGEALISLGLIKEEQMVSALGKQLNIPYFSLSRGVVKPATDQGLQKLIPQDFAFKNSVVPLSRTLKSLTVAMSDPLDLILIDNLKKITGCEINPVIATRSDIQKTIEEFYGKSKMLEDAVEASYDLSTEEPLLETESVESELSLDKLIARAEEAPVVKLVDLIIRQAINERASDIHMEPFKDRISLRYRIDGKLYEIPPPAKHLHLPIISRVKILAKLDIAEKRLPQDGTIVVKIDERPIDIRVSIIPTIYGEKGVLRILDRSSVVLDLDRLGFDPKQLALMRSGMDSPYGLIFLTGPTGSGKTTTLAAMLNEMKDTTKNIITIEDPVEYKIEGINQVQVKPDIGLTFATALRSFLRQDPDIMLVGEVRDLETAQICIRSALTGHLVLSTLHTNDAPTAVTRLIDIGIEPYMIAPALLLVVAQRLLRKLCPDCKEAYELSKEEMDSLQTKVELFYKPKGCSKCNQLGYKGRFCVSEVMAVNEEMQNYINEGASFQKIREIAKKNGMQTLYDTAIKRAEDGLTSLEEALSVSYGAE